MGDGLVTDHALRPVRWILEDGHGDPGVGPARRRRRPIPVLYRPSSPTPPVGVWASWAPPKIYGTGLRLSASLRVLPRGVS